MKDYQLLGYLLLKLIIIRYVRKIIEFSACTAY